MSVNTAGLGALLRDAVQAQDIASALLIPVHSMLYGVATLAVIGLVLLGMSVALVKSLTDERYRLSAIIVQVIAAAVMLMPTAISVNTFATAFHPVPAAVVTQTQDLENVNEWLHTHLPPSSRDFQASAGVVLMMKVVSALESLLYEGIDAGYARIDSRRGEPFALYQALAVRNVEYFQNAELGDMLAVWHEHCGPRILSRNNLNGVYLRAIGLGGAAGSIGLSLAISPSAMDRSTLATQYRGAYTLDPEYEFTDAEYEHIRTELSLIRPADAGVMRVWESFRPGGFHLPSASMLAGSSPTTDRYIQKLKDAGSIPRGYVERPLSGGIHGTDFRFPVIRLLNNSPDIAASHRTAFQQYLQQNPDVRTFYENWDNDPANRKNWYVTNCWEMYVLVDAAVAEARVASIAAYARDRGFNPDDFEMQYLGKAPAIVLRTKNSSALLALTGAVAHMNANGTLHARNIGALPVGILEQRAEMSNTIGAEFKGLGSSMWEEFEEFKIDVFVYYSIGFVALMVGVWFAISPIIIMFSVIPGRGHTILLALGALVWMKITLFLQYLFLHLGGLVTEVVGSSMVATYEAGAVGNTSVLTIALSAGIGTLVGTTIVSPLFAYMLVFNQVKALTTMGAGEATKASIATATAVSGAILNLVTRGRSMAARARK